MNKEKLIKEARNPKYISGIYNYCDRWCERCQFTFGNQVLASSCNESPTLHFTSVTFGNQVLASIFNIQLQGLFPIHPIQPIQPITLSLSLYLLPVFAAFPRFYHNLYQYGKSWKLQFDLEQPDRREPGLHLLSGLLPSPVHH